MNMCPKPRKIKRIESQKNKNHFYVKRKRHVTLNERKIPTTVDVDCKQKQENACMHVCKKCPTHLEQCNM